MKKLTGWTKKPVTWGAVAAMSLISVATCAVEVVCLTGAPQKVVDKVKSLKK